MDTYVKLLRGLAIASSLIVLVGCECSHYVRSDQTLDVKGLTGAIGKLSATSGDITFKNQYPVVPVHVIEIDQAQYHVCQAISTLPSGPTKVAKQSAYVDKLMEILEETAKANPKTVLAKQNEKVATQTVVPVPGDSTKVETVRIDEPKVNATQNEYTYVTFHTNDKVTINAGGCVQTGGSGSTWKRYVDPDPNDKYFGTVTIPGVINNTRLSDVIGKSIAIPSSSDGKHLTLGYTDDDYDDNGYWKHDDGTNGQCKGVGPAYVIVTITHS